MNNQTGKQECASAKNGELLIIPFSMSEGAVLAIGKGNPERNYSAPHDSGH